MLQTKKAQWERPQWRICCPHSHPSHHTHPQTNERKIFPVNPNRGKVFDLDCYPSIREVPEKVDLAVIATPAKTAPGIVEECGEAGVEGVIIISSGFKEVGEEGKELEEEIKVIRKKYGIRIIGPNCLGVIRPSISLNASSL